MFENISEIRRSKLYVIFFKISQAKPQQIVKTNRVCVDFIFKHRLKILQRA